MQIPLQVSFHNLPHSDAIEDLITERVELLEEFAEDIMSCRVVVDVPHRHHEHGNLYQVRVDLKLPGKEIASTHEPGERGVYEDINLAIRDAFDSVVRQIEDFVRRRRGDVKAHR
jgi:ribosome-associated translation inhibitor RaiA